MTHFLILFLPIEENISHVIEEWKEYLEKEFFTVAVFMDLSKAFDCIPHDLLIVKLNGYSFDRKSFKFFCSFLKWRKQIEQIHQFK